MDITIIIGIIGAAIILFFGTPEVIKDPMGYADIKSATIVIVGTHVATIISTNLPTIKNLVKVFMFILIPPKKKKIKDVIDQMVGFSKVVSSQGKLGLQENIQTEKDPFMIHALTMIVDNMDGEFIKRALIKDIDEMESRHIKYIGIVKNMGSLAPMFGMMGTIVGLIQVLKNMQDPTMIGPAMAVALLTSLYGAILNGAFYTPISIKLQEMNDDEALIRTIIMEGILLVEKIEIPIKVEKYLMGYLSDTEKLKAKKK